MKKNVVSLTDPSDWSWNHLNDRLRTMREEAVAELLSRELSGKARRQYLLRIHSRQNKVRADRERAELVRQS